MPPQSRELNDRFKAHVAKAERVRRIIVTTLVATCVLAGSGLAFAVVAPPESGVRATLNEQLAAVSGSTSGFGWIGDWLSSIFEREETPPPMVWDEAVVPARTTPPPSARVEDTLELETVRAAPAVPRQPPAPTTVINQPVIERTIERIGERTTTSAGVSEERLNLRLADLTSLLRSEFLSPQVSYSGPSAPVSTQTFAQSQRIDHLSGVAIENPTITDGSISGTTISGTISAAIDSAVAVIKNLTSTSGVVMPLANGANGLVLKIVGCVPSWSTDISGGGGGSSAWATTSDDLAVYLADTADLLLVGNNATTTTGNILEVAGNSLFRGSLTAYNTLTAPRFVATSTTASVFPYASSTALTVSGTGYFGTASTTNLTISGASGGLLKTSATGLAHHRRPS